jgi:methylenetetrahydrofolate dehydrogenase (NADP+)/methenyltetrahydrofolate cyclohydrolase/formyltetrahydrofolate synthetase
MSATKIDGKAIAADIRTELRTTVDDLKARHPGFSPHLTIIQVGGRDDSSLYVRQKQKAAEEAGISFYHEHLDESISQKEVGPCSLSSQRICSPNHPHNTAPLPGGRPQQG